MTLLKRLVIIFSSVTVACSVCFFFIGDKMIEEMSSGELDRGSGRTRGVISSLNGEVEKRSSKVFEFSNYISIEERLEENRIINAKEIVNVQAKIKNIPVQNIFTLDSSFKIKEILKGDKTYIKSENIKNIINQSIELFEKPENYNKGFLRGIVNGDDAPYIVGLKKINKDKSNSDYIMVIDIIDTEFIKMLEESTARDLEIINANNVNKDVGYILHKQYDMEFYAVATEQCIDIYSSIDSLNGENQFFIKLLDDRVVRNNMTRGINALLILIISLTVIANMIVCLLIKNNVISRILKINTAVNSIKEGQHLDIQIVDEYLGDEISTLNNDINEMFKRLKNYSDNLQYLGSHDALTSIENRHSITRAISDLVKDKEEFAILFMDLDNFKVINDNLGHEVGDNLLIKISDDLICIKSQYDNLLVGRLGGDEFVIIRKGKNSDEKIKKLAQKILTRINKLYNISSYSYEIKASMGISYFPQHTSEESELLQYSDIAMYCSKKRGGNTFEVFTPKMLEPLKIEKMLKKAILNNEFEVYLQPIYNLERNTVKGAEALVRWNKDGEVIAPFKFLQVAKNTGDIVDIDNLVFSKAVALCKEIIASGKTNFYISINTSKLFLQQVGLIPFILNELKENYILPEHIKIEITEDEIIDDFEYTIEILNKIREIGIDIYLDDFGVGYSSFSHIKILPVDVIKIDRSLILDIENNKKTQEIVKTMILLAHSLSMEVVCEGIEEGVQVDILKKLECDSIQGYYYSKPLNSNDFKQYINHFKKNIE
ncbi:MAG: EAL domain-containing protein [Sarcina sp.]